jgi:hypothetical protein
MWTHELKMFIETRPIGATTLRHSKNPDVERLGLRRIPIDAPKMLENLLSSRIHPSLGTYYHHYHICSFCDNLSTHE